MPGPAELPAPGAGGPGKSAWGDLRTRVLSAALLAPFGLICIWAGSWAWAALVLVAVLGMAREWVGLCRAPATAFAGLAVIVLAGAGVVVAAVGAPAVALAVIGLGGLILWAVARRPALPAGVPYVGLGGIALVWLRADGAAGLANVLFVILLVWASDVGAYVVGRLIGGRKLAPRISPGKTWSGAAGGLAAAMLTGVIFALAAGGPAWWAALVGGLLGVVSQAGDLLESAVKRHFGVKDSGGLIPGHGGLLDRLDGLLAAAPVAGVIALAIGSGVALWR